MSKLRSYRNVSAVPLEICEVGKPIKHRVRVEPGEISPLVRVSDAWHRYITETTGFAQLMDEQEVQDDVPEGYVETTGVGDVRRRFRPMNAVEREAAGLAPLPSTKTEPLPAVVVKPSNAVRGPATPTPAPAPAPASAPAVIPAPPAGNDTVVVKK
jgi:hypothetical protein